MKNHLILLFAISCSFCSCQNNAPKGSAIINGILKPFPGETIYILPQENCVGFKDYSALIDSIVVDSLGYFHYDLKLLNEGESEIMLITKQGYHILNLPLYVTNADSFHCEIQNDNDEYKYRITGNGKYCGEYQCIENLNKAITKADWSRVDYSQSEDSFLVEMKQREQLYAQVINSFFDSINVTDNYLKELIWQDKLLSLSNDYYRYLNYHNYYANDTFFYKLDFSKDFASFLDRITEIDLKMPFSSNHINLIENQIQFVFSHSKLDSLEYEDQPAAKWELIEHKFTGNNQMAAIFYFLQNFSHTMAIDGAFELLEKCKTLASNTLTKSQFDIFDKKYNKLCILKSGSPAPDFNLPDVEGNLVKLSDYKGKVIYIDFWGTWCMPCLQEIENNHAILDSFASRDDFIMLSVSLEYGDEEIDKWRRFVGGENIYPNIKFLDELDLSRGNHLVAEKQFNNKQIAPYKVNYAPTYVLIDKDFNIAKARAERPKNAFESIRNLLNKNN